ncbi:MAG TPA: hypothetical protein VMR25_25130 [Planctomycetaceae bacterium]|nr:hypothetical protein [Planctomycetaceae bacterium]
MRRRQYISFPDKPDITGPDFAGIAQLLRPVESQYVDAESEYDKRRATFHQSKPVPATATTHREKQGGGEFLEGHAPHGKKETCRLPHGRDEVYDRHNERKACKMLIGRAESDN